jgi:hypothetical protein
MQRLVGERSEKVSSMSSLNRARLLGLSVSLLAPFGCGDDGEHHPHHDASMMEHDAGEVLDELPCDASTHPGLTPGLSVAAGDLTVRVVSSEPLQRARQKVFNDWVLEVLDARGMAMSDAQASGASAFMRVHGHYGLPAPTVVQQPEPGRFLMDNIYFSMRGPWEVNVTLQRGDTRSLATFKICVE